MKELSALLLAIVLVGATSATATLIVFSNRMTARTNVGPGPFTVSFVELSADLDGVKDCDVIVLATEPAPGETTVDVDAFEGDVVCATVEFANTAERAFSRLVIAVLKATPTESFVLQFWEPAIEEWVTIDFEDDEWRSDEFDILTAGHVFTRDARLVFLDESAHDDPYAFSVRLERNVPPGISG